MVQERTERTTQNHMSEKNYNRNEQNPNPSTLHFFFVRFVRVQLDESLYVLLISLIACKMLTFV